MTYKGIPISLSPDFTAENCRPEGSVTKILYPPRFSFRFNKHTKSFTGESKSSVQYHQTSFTTNAQGTSLCGKHKRRKRLKINKPQTIRETVTGTRACALSCSVTKSPTLCHPMDSSPPASSLHGIFQARILEWVAISSPR